jgi:hypothetical protein
MEERITKEDLRQFGMQLLGEIRQTIQSASIAPDASDLHPEWLKSARVRKLMDMSPGSLQNLRIKGKIRYKKIMGCYYYNKADLQNMFNDK